MRLIETLQRRADEEPSLFRAQLLREDVARLRRLQELARSAPDLATFTKAGMRAGWTQGDARTHELREPLQRLLELVHGYETGADNADLEAAIEGAWLVLHRYRMERLVGCLSTPAPRPVPWRRGDGQ